MIDHLIFQLPDAEAEDYGFKIDGALWGWRPDQPLARIVPPPAPSPKVL
jgi:hypothetical protein